ncbi:acyl-CoA dehydrogenase family protein [Frankia sp. CNm7]|uniref:Acyl-CoA dehydrogenase family protein n=1 Tax=Frankia nepalensis TaxID=1836974 RepID=A0A937RBC9_9ACTN|nr:acyl-CoA dehydrogenase family protein [Frankia nepalensis]MBL7500015.1 acyl-CoA dehydrogenase family protein [Frankia nepalensis]MBL7510639.1 acyl-CoA dehydrogenase family protein [Frankia nepalensis]MBL7520780.1 acyl-CoA dehydrogenase family protein [Frankia nepalensis]MBL7627172.1 acyl-CoA dehydrogenase family protein [Frankia nepalensis]
MDPDLSPDQRLLRETTERFIEANLPLARLRELIDAGDEVDPSYRRDGAELGWFAFLAPESLGGGSVSGDGVLDAVVLAELRGRYLQPGAFIDTNLAVATLAREGSEEQRTKVVPTLISGEAAVAWAVADATGDWSGSSGVGCEPTRGGYRLTGRKGLVVEARSAQWLLVTAVAPDGLTQFLLPTATPGVTVEAMTSLDLSRRLCEVRFDDVEVDGSALVGTPGAAATAVDAQLLLAGVLAAAETVGAMQYLFDLTVQYCKDRVAFGRPIGSFQAIKHQLADTSLALEMSHAVATGAAREAQREGRGAAHAASMAKAFVGDAAVELAHKCWQLFGGISYTWEHDFHLYLRRLTTDASLYGSPTWHRERLCQLAGL